MIHTKFIQSNIRKIALVGNYLPRRCGIATFTTDLLTALTREDTGSEFWAVVMNDTPQGYAYPNPVRFELNQKTLADYRMAADFLNINQVDLVCLQHEFGIFGGNDGAYIIELINNLRMPIVTTLHTVLQNPTANQATILKRIGQISERLVVMSQKAAEILNDVLDIEKDKIVTIHHGIPDVPFVDPVYYKDQFGVEGRKVILTFGLLSPGKGIETMIEALPEIVEIHPDVVYMVVGATHPAEKRIHGESYRHYLQMKARELGVDEYLIFHNRFVEQSELLEVLGAADIYVTPYLNKEQVVSGTLAYALGAGKATVSTPYWYAQEMLANGRGRIVPFKDKNSLSKVMIELLTNETERHTIRKQAYSFCREMVWKEVARKFLKVFMGAKQTRQNRPKPTFKAKTLKLIPRELPKPDLNHIIRLTDNVGMLQHARYIIPNRFHGYCTDDNARALIAAMKAQSIVEDAKDIKDLACVYLAFISFAFNEKTGRFRNFMNYDRTWLEEIGSEDSHGRAMWALGEAIWLDDSNIRDAALVVFKKALPALLEFTAPRSWAFALVGIQSYLGKFGGDSEVRRIREKLVEQLYAMYLENATPEWPWIEDTLTYANGKIAQALIVCGKGMEREDILNAGLNSLKWLIEIQIDPAGHFSPVGNNGWYTRGKEKARFDQQPIEVSTLIEACREAYVATRDANWITHAQRGIEWFLGKNDYSVPLFDYKTGGCCDGLNVDGPNRNQGAESTLAWFLSLLSIYELRNNQVSIETAETAIIN